MYAIVKTGGKQYRVERGESLLVERLPADDGATVALEPLLYVDGSEVLDGGDLSKVKVSARVVGHERGPKLRIVKFKPKRGYKRRTGHRQELTRLEVTEIKLGSGRSRSAPGGRAAAAAEPAAGKASPAEQAARKEDAAEPVAAKASTPKPAGDAAEASKARTPKPAAAKADAKPAATKPTPSKPRVSKAPKASEEVDDGT
jgi:large subunit ribosomal protein L21